MVTGQRRARGGQRVRAAVRGLGRNPQAGGRGWAASPRALQGRPSDVRERATTREQHALAQRGPSRQTLPRASLRLRPMRWLQAKPRVTLRLGASAPRRPRHPPAHLGNAAQVVAGIRDAEAQDQRYAHSGPEEPHPDLVLQVEGELTGEQPQVHG